MIDSHCHLDSQYYGAERPEVLARARAAGVSAFVTIGGGGGLTAPREAVELASAEPDVYATVGVHPHDVAAMTEEDWRELETLAPRPRVVGGGETGVGCPYEPLPPR